MSAESYISGGYERLPMLVGQDAWPGQGRPGGVPRPPEQVTPPLGPRGPAADEGPGPHPTELTAWTGDLGPVARGPAPFLAQRIAQEIPTEGPRTGSAAAGVYRSAADARVIILGPEASVDITV